MSKLLRTPLYERHKALGAKLVPFAGYEMPVEYQGILGEHAAVRNAMGLFDVSHMGEIEVRGKRAVEFCQKVSTNDASALKAGKVQYTAVLNENGGMLDDCCLYRLAEDHFLFVVNASNREKLANWFAGHQMDGAKVEDRSDDYALLALQGKKAEELLSKVIRRDLGTVLYYEFIWAELLGAAALISRTGYTGEDGFEIYIPTGKAVEVWDLLMETGGPQGLTPIGLGARDTLRLEMGYLLYGNDMTEDVTPLEAGIGWAVKLDKGSFIGRERLLEQKAQGVLRRIRGLKVDGRGIPRPHYEIHHGGKKVGDVTSGTFSPSLKNGIALAMLDPTLELGESVDVIVRDKPVKSVLVKPPFVPGSVKR